MTVKPSPKSVSGDYRQAFRAVFEPFSSRLFTFGGLSKDFMLICSFMVSSLWNYKKLRIFNLAAFWQYFLD